MPTVETRPTGTPADSDASDADELPVGSSLGRFVVLRLAGSGAMGDVYEARDPELGRSVALKVLAKVHGENEARLVREARALAQLAHPNVVGIHEAGVAGDRVFIAMEFVDGQTLGDLLRPKHRSWREILALFVQAGRGLAAAHERGIVHRDFKPANVLVDASGRVRVTDFGLARVEAQPEEPATRAADEVLQRDAALTVAGSYMGTPRYMSPEQRERLPATTRSDQYSFCVALWEALCGEMPPGRRHPVPRWLLRALRIGLADDPARRHASMAALLQILERTPVVRRRVAVAAAVATLFLLAAGAILFVAFQRVVRERNRAQRRFDDVRALAGSLVFEVDEKLRDLKGATAARELLVGRALAYLDSLASEAAGDDALVREVATAYMMVGDIQGSRHIPSLGRPRDGLASYDKAQALIALLHRDDRPTRWVRALQLFGRSPLMELLGDRAGALTALRSAFESARRDPPVTDDERRAVARGLVFEQVLVDQAEAPRLAEELRELTRRWRAAADSVEARYWSEIAEEMASDAHRLLGEPALAVKESLTGVGFYARLIAEHPDDEAYPREQAFALMATAMASRGAGNSYFFMPATGDAALAEASLRQAAKIATRLSANDPHDIRAAMFVAELLAALAEVVGARDTHESLAIYDEARARLDALPASARHSANVASTEAFLLCSEAPVLARAHRSAEAVEAARAGSRLAIDETKQACALLAAEMHIALGDDRAAREALTDAFALLDADLAARPNLTNNYVAYAHATELAARLAPAEACARRRQALACGSAGRVRRRNTPSARWARWSGRWPAVLRAPGGARQRAGRGGRGRARARARRRGSRRP